MACFIRGFITKCEDFCEVCVTFCSKRQKVPKAFQTAKSIVFGILFETNMNCKSTNKGVGPDQIHPINCLFGLFIRFYPGQFFEKNFITFYIRTREQNPENLSAYNTFDEIPSQRPPIRGQNVTCKIFPESELWFSHNLDLCVWE